MLKQLAGGAAMNWLAVLTAIATTFFLSPYVVRKLGDTGYGVWILVTSSVAYMAILEMGLRGAVTYFVARHHARADHAAASRSFSAVFWVRLTIGMVVLAATAVIWAFITSIFRIPVEYHAAARTAVLLAGTSFAVSLTCGVFAGVIAGLCRYDILSGIAIAQNLAAAAGTVALLYAGYGIVALALWQAVAVLAGSAAQVWFCFRLYPELRIGFERPESGALREIFSYSGYLLLAGIAGQVIWYTGNLIVGAFVSAAAVTVFSIAVRLLEYQRQMTASLAQAIVPLASSLQAREGHENLRRLLLHGTRISLLVGWPIQVALLFRGATFIGLWMGPEYAEPSGRILRILLLSGFVITGNHAAANIAFGLAKHKPFALWQTAEAAVNLGLAVVLARAMGSEGVAWAIAIPSLITQAFIWPNYICRVLSYPVRLYLVAAWFRPALATIPYTAGCILANRFWQAENLKVFFLQMCVLLALYAASAGLVFRAEILRQWRNPESFLRRYSARLPRLF